MGRVLLSLLIFFLAIPQGAMSAGLPHRDGAVHERIFSTDHYDVHDTELVGDDATGQDGTVEPGDPDAGKAPHGAGHHVHSLGDSLPIADAAFPDRLLAKDRFGADDDARLLSMTPAPLPEPPSA